MAFRAPRDLLIECGGCGIENMFTDYTPAMPAVCNQCRERQIWPNFNETHHEYVCQDCGISICLKQSTVFDLGNTPCRCGKLKVIKVETSTIAQEAEAAGATELEEPDPSDIDTGYDWFRSEPEADPGTSDFNELFDQDPGHN